LDLSFLVFYQYVWYVGPDIHKKKCLETHIGHFPIERDPLIAGGSNGNHSHRRGGSLAKLQSVLAAQGQPSYVASFKWFLFDSWWNVLLVFIPLSFVAHHLNWDAALRFSFSFFAIMPLARVCVLSAQRAETSC
jgi:hypothetical protein